MYAPKNSIIINRKKKMILSDDFSTNDVDHHGPLIINYLSNQYHLNGLP